MGQLNAKLRSVRHGIGHWCPGCEGMHVITTEGDQPPVWQFDGNLDAPTVSPSVMIRRPPNAAQWNVRDEHVCHYFLRAGQLQFLDDSSHQFRGKTVPLPDLSDHHR